MTSKCDSNVMIGSIIFYQRLMHDFTFVICYLYDGCNAKNKFIQFSHSLYEYYEWQQQQPFASLDQGLRP